MRAEIISIGTELLLGQIVNTNAAYIASELKELGIDSYYQTTVGDNEKRIHEVLGKALKRSNVIITTGGLGPTADDLTHESIYSFFKIKPKLDKTILKQIVKKFHLKGYKKMPPINKKQAYKPKNAKWIPNNLGTANGIILKPRRNLANNVSTATIITFPGVPGEMKSMWQGTVKPYLKQISGNTALYSKTLKFTGIGESALAEKIKPFFRLKNPTVAPYASIGEVKIRITAKADNIKKARKIVMPTVKRILAKTQGYYYGKDTDTLENLIAKKLTSKKKTVSTAESCTGGLLSARLTDVPGSSKYIKLNLVTYSNDAKAKMLNVPPEELKQFGAISPEVARSMAIGIRNLSGCDYGISVTGIAGPGGGSKEKPVGLVYFGLATKNKVRVEKKLFGVNSKRDEIRWLATQFALTWFLKELK